MGHSSGHLEMILNFAIHIMEYTMQSQEYIYWLGCPVILISTDDCVHMVSVDETSANTHSGSFGYPCFIGSETRGHWGHLPPQNVCVHSNLVFHNRNMSC